MGENLRKEIKMKKLPFNIQINRFLKWLNGYNRKLQLDYLRLWDERKHLLDQSILAEIAFESAVQELNRSKIDAAAKWDLEVKELLRSNKNKIIENQRNRIRLY